MQKSFCISKSNSPLLTVHKIYEKWASYLLWQIVCVSFNKAVKQCSCQILMLISLLVLRKCHPALKTTCRTSHIIIQEENYLNIDLVTWLYLTILHLGNMHLMGLWNRHIINRFSNHVLFLTLLLQRKPSLKDHPEIKSTSLSRPHSHRPVFVFFSIAIQ